MVKARKYVVKNHFQGVPKLSDYEIVEEELPPLKDNEFLVKTEWISVDPYLRAYNSQINAPYDQFSFQIALVQESKNPDYPVGTRVVSHKGWCDYTIINPKLQSDFLDTVYTLPDLKGLSNSLALGAVGMPGATAYFGFLEICKPKPDETVVVTGAAGAVGSIVGQIAKIKGCKVIGFAGSDEKVQWLEKELGFDKAINYKTADVAKALKEAAPNGVDCYFDNVGGELSSVIINQLNVFGRVSVCGSISSYNDDLDKLPKASIVQPALVFRQLKVEGFIVSRWRERWSEAFTEIITWILNGKMKPREHVTEGFDNLFKAFTGMLAGENYGKAIVKV
ncbi:prostaglandin reductase 1-like [Achroia grisella]|uniref:prostaglandin reductase 1-like n=1 Tax=Achroia grisella TaxID=688607 RepID=UPI0027D25141|nr:prostaglandin reductase 1-like [Achroia grisella]XP_059048575.1 prostaglandin reductase 1-like [Achroia grisella]